MPLAGSWRPLQAALTQSTDLSGNADIFTITGNCTGTNCERRLLGTSVSSAAVVGISVPTSPVKRCRSTVGLGTDLYDGLALVGIHLHVGITVSASHRLWQAPTHAY